MRGCFDLDTQARACSVFLLGGQGQYIDCEILTRDGEVLTLSVPKAVVLSGRYVDADSSLPVVDEIQLKPQMCLFEEFTAENQIRNLASHQEEEASRSILDALNNASRHNHLRSVNFDKHGVERIPQVLLSQYSKI